MQYHQPVMASECLEALDIKPDGIYVDATFGGGGHSKLILEKLGPDGRLFAFDQDDDAAANVPDDKRLVFVNHNFRYMGRFLRFYGVEAVDGILADLGVSSHQLDEAERGFSFRFSALLDMRMNRKDGPTTAEVLNTCDAATLQEVFSRYGEVRNAKTLAQAIVRERQLRPISTVEDLLSVASPLIRGNKQRYLAQVFQALRIHVNDELGALEALLTTSKAYLKKGGRLVVLSYHSLEDRLVKRFLKTGNVQGDVERDFYGNIERPFYLVFPGVKTPGEEELRNNPRARSARLRAGIRR